MMRTTRRWQHLAAAVLVAAAAGPAAAGQVPAAAVQPERLPAPREVPPTDAGPGPADGPSIHGTTSANPKLPGPPPAAIVAPPSSGGGAPREYASGVHGQFRASALGSALYAQANAMVANGEAAQMVLYRYDFIDGHAQLSLRGHDQLGKILALLALNPGPLVIERTPWLPALAEARRLEVLAQLAHAGCLIPPERVVVGVPVAFGLSGPESVRVYTNLLNQVRSQGSQAVLSQESLAGGTSGQGTAGTTTGGGFGGSAGGSGGSLGGGLGMPVGP
jgi:hypothetical protein